VRRKTNIVAAFAALTVLASAEAPAADSLPSWNEGAAKQSIIEFVEKTTKSGSADFVPAEQRIAVFDNDGTLWCEQPVYVQVAFAIDRVKALAPKHPEWKEKEPFASLLRGDAKAALAGGERSAVEIIIATHVGMTTEEFRRIVKEWLKTARHPVYQRPYSELAYQPMLEVLAHLRQNGFKTYIVSGGGVEFMRAFALEVYGVPPEQVIGSSGKTRFEMRDGKPVLVKQPEILFIDDGPGKPEGINLFIGRRPLMAFGNSDGDLNMLQWTTAGEGAHFGLIVHHTDAKREVAYDRESHIGKLDKALDAADSAGWTVVDMAQDWKVVFPASK